MPYWRDLFSFGLHCYWAAIFKRKNSYCFIGWFLSLLALTNSVVLSLDDFLLIACHVYTLCFLGCHTSLGYIPIPIADQAAKWGWWFFIILFHFNTRFISSRIWRATIHIESHLKSDDSYRVAFEERRFISSRIWRTTIHIESCLKSDDSISSRIVSESHLGNSRFVRLSFRSYFRADICWGVSKS